MKHFYATDPKYYIKREYEARNGRNPAYSWRSFARDLGISPSMLSEFVHGRYGFSRRKALSVAEILRLHESESQHFLDLLEAEFHRSEKVREAAKLRVQRRLGAGLRSDLKHWRQFAQLEVPGPGTWCLPEESDAPTALHTHDELTIAGNSDDEICALNSQILALAERAMSELSPSECDALSVFVRLSSAQIAPMVREMNEALLQILNKYTNTRETADRVYAVSLQGFPVFRRG